MEQTSPTLPDKTSLFDNAFREYVKQCKNVIKQNYPENDGNIYLDPNMKAIKNYFRLYKKMSADEHFQYFEKIFAINRTKILNNENDEWIRKGDIIIQLGGLQLTGIKTTDEKRKQVRIYVSNIYNIACKLRDNAKELFDNIDLKFVDEKSKMDIQTPDLLLLHIFKIFSHLSNNDDKLILIKNINKLEDKLGILIKTIIPTNITPTPTNTTNTNTNAGGFSGLFSIARTIMESSGIKPPPEMKTPTDDDVSRSINAVFQSEGTQNVIKKMVTSLQGCNDVGTMFQSVVSDIANPTTISVLQSSIQQTAQQAVKPNDVVNVSTESTPLNNTNNSMNSGS